MKISMNPYKKHISLSAHEAALLSVVEPFLVFSVKKIERCTNWKKTTVQNTLQSLKNKKMIIALKKDMYVAVAKINENMLKIAVELTAPSYVSFWTACSYYGWTEQQVRSIQLVSTKQFQQINSMEFPTIEVVTVIPPRMFGIAAFHDIPFAEKEKLIIDMLSKPELCGGRGEVSSCLIHAWKEINEAKLLAYLKQYESKAIFARLGYFLEKMNLKNTIEHSLLKHLPKGYTPLDKEKHGKRIYNKYWRVILYDQ